MSADDMTMPRPAGRNSARRQASPVPRLRRHPLADPPWLKSILIAIALLFVALFLLMPLLAVFAEALSVGLLRYWHNISDPDALAAMRLTLFVAVIAVPCNLAFGLATAWAVTKSRMSAWGLCLWLTW